jgi:hypothetical protein
MSAFAMSEEELQQYATDYKAQVIAQRLERKQLLADHQTKMDQLPWLPGTSVGSGSFAYSSQAFTGLCYKDKTSSDRCKTNYHSHHERLWCEAHDLCDHGFFEEAKERTDQMTQYDEKLEALISAGLALNMSKTSTVTSIGVTSGAMFDQMKQLFNNAVQTLMIELQRDNNSEDWEVFERLMELVKAREKLFIPYKIEGTENSQWSSPDYTAASSVALEETAIMWTAVFSYFDAAYCFNDGDADSFHDSMICKEGIIDELLKRDDLDSKTAIKNVAYRYNNMIGPYWSSEYDANLFVALAGEIAESINEYSYANEAYKKLLKMCSYKSGAWVDPYKEGNGTNVVMEHFELVLINGSPVADGSLQERIQRTKTMSIGDRCLVHHLESEAGQLLNGQHVTLVKAIIKNGRFKCKFDDGTFKQIKLCNLQIINVDR